MEKFSLKWNDYQSNVTKTFGSLRRESDFYDVTLVSDDEQLVSAHKVVLSSSSEFFKNILKKTKENKNPLIFLSGVESKNLNLILDYIYQGEVQIFQDDLDSFLAVAQQLKIEGLTGGGEENQDEEKVMFENNTENFRDSESVDLTIQEIHQPEQNEERIAKPQTVSRYTSNRSSNYEGREAVTALLEKVGDVWRCKECGKIAKTSTNLRLHAETHVDGLSFDCSKCDQSFRSRNNLYVHSNRKHK